MSTSGMARPQEQVEKRNDYGDVYFVGTVVNNDSSQATDGKKDGRVQVRIPNLLTEVPDDMLPWARPAKSMGRGSSASVQSFCVPIIGAKLIVILQNGDPYHPLYIGGLLTAEDLADIFQTNYPFRYGFQDDKGNQLYVDTQSGDVEFKHFSGSLVHIDPNGTINVTGVKDLNANFQGNATVKVVGNTSLEVDGNVTAKVEGTCDAEVDGALSVHAKANATVQVDGNLAANVTGSTNVNSTGAMTLQSSAAITITAPSVAIN